jgi:flagellar basal-body rod protein FlgG
LNTSLFISSGALQAYQQKIDTAANNVANVNTTGYKRRDQSFSEILAAQINNQGRPDQEIGRLTPNGVRIGYGVRTGLTQLDTEQGQAIETGNPFDLMIQGNGFFQVGYPSATAGAADDVRYTLELDGQNEVMFDSTGQIQLKNKNGQGATFSSPQQVGIVDIQNPHILRNLGDNEFAIDNTELANGTNAANYVRMMVPGEAQISSGSLEGSNVDLSKEMTDLMTSQRSFQMNARAVSYADQMLGIANNIMK